MTERLKNIEDKIKSLKRAKRNYYLFIGTTFALLAFTVGILAFSVIDLATSTDYSVRQVFLTMVIFLSIVLLAYLGVAPVVKSLRQILLAREVERKFPELDNSLLTAIEYGNDPVKQNRFSTREMVDALVRKTDERTGPLNFLECVKWKKLRNSGIVFGVIVALLAAYLSFIPDSGTAMLRTLSPWVERTYTRILSDTGDMEIEEYSDVVIAASISGRIPETSVVHFEDKKGEWRSLEMVATGRSDTDFRFSIKNVVRDFSYSIEAGDAKTGLYSVKVYAVPKIEALKLKLKFPEYTSLPSQELNTGAVVALRGTEVTIEGETNTTVAKAWLDFDDGEDMPLDIDGLNVTGRFTIEKDCNYTLRIEDPSGRPNKYPISYPVTALKDRKPDIRIVQPNHDLQLIGTSEVPITIDAADDYGVSEIGIVVRVMARSMESPEEMQDKKTVIRKLEVPKTFESCDYTLLLEDYILESHDLISFHAYAIDNDAISGPKRSVSKIYFIEVLPYEEIIREMAGMGMKMMPRLDVLKKLIRVQREIIARTFAVRNEVTDPLEEDVRDLIQDLAALQMSNAEEATDYAETLRMELIEARMESELGRVDAIVTAAEYMFKAQEVLETLDPEEAAQPEQQALASLYQALIDLEKMISREGKEGQKELEKIRERPSTKS